MKIRNITVILVAFLLTSCAPAVEVVPTKTVISTLPLSTVTPYPTLTSIPPTLTPTSTPIPTFEIDGLIIPDPRYSNPELFGLDEQNAPIPQFVNALGSIGIEVDPDAVADGIIYKAIQSQTGDTVILALTSNLSETSYDESNFPLFVYMKQPGSINGTWRTAYLKDIASLHHILIGAVINAAEEIEINAKTGMFTNNFNMATISWSSVDVPLEIMDRDTKYRLSQIQNEDLEEIMWFHLGDIPLSDKTFASKDEAVAYINSEIDKITKKYGDKMTIVNIFNEVNPFTKTIWKQWKQFGDELFFEVYQHVRETLPGTKIIYNEGYNYTKSYEGTNYPYSLDIVNRLKGQIDAVGMEMHMAQSQWGAETPTSIDEMVEIMRSFGISVYITELDVNQTYLSGTEQEKAIEQARIYEMVVRSCVKSQVCEMINFWGQADPYSWYVFAINEPDAKACLFDGEGHPKLGYYSVLRGLLEGIISSNS